MSLVGRGIGAVHACGKQVAVVVFQQVEESLILRLTFECHVKRLLRSQWHLFIQKVRTSVGLWEHLLGSEFLVVVVHLPSALESQRSTIVGDAQQRAALGLEEFVALLDVVLQGLRLVGDNDDELVHEVVEHLLNHSVGAVTVYVGLRLYALGDVSVGIDGAVVASGLYTF